MGVEMAKDGVWAGVCCPLARGVAQASRKWLCWTTSVLGVLRMESGNAPFLGVEDGLGRGCQSVDLLKHAQISLETNIKVCSTQVNDNMET